MIEILSMLFGAAWRIWDGTGKWLPGAARVSIGGVLCLAMAAGGLDPRGALDWAVTVLVAASVLWAMVRGYDDWAKADLAQITHYWPAAIGAVIVAAYTGTIIAPLGYVGMLVMAGLAHPVMSELNWPHATRYAEGVAGALVIGGLAFL